MRAHPTHGRHRRRVDRHRRRGPTGGRGGRRGAPPVQLPVRGHGDWWPDYVVHADAPEHPDRHYHYVRDQLVVAQDDLSGLRKRLRRRAGVEVGGSLDESSDVQVLTMPFGGYSHDDLGMLATSAALRYLFDRRPDLVAVAGAGNDATNKPYFPAADRGVIAVGAVQRDRSGRWRRACFSNYGPWVDASAPGVNVLSTSAAPMVAAAIGEGRSGPDAARHVLQAPGAPRIDNLGTIVAPGGPAPA